MDRMSQAETLLRCALIHLCLLALLRSASGENPVSDPAGTTPVRADTPAVAEDSVDLISGSVAPAEPVDTAYLVVLVESNPPGATVTLDGVAAGTTPDTIEGVVPGRREIEFALPGFYRKRVVVSAGGGDTVRLSLPLNAPAALSIVTTPDSASVHLNGTDTLHSPATFSPLKPDTYPVRLIRSGYQPVDTTVLLESGEIDTLNVILVRTPAWVDSVARVERERARKKTRSFSVVSLSLFVIFALVVGIAELAQ